MSQRLTNVIIKHCIIADTTYNPLTRMPHGFENTILL